MTWILWFVFVVLEVGYSVPLDRYDSETACQAALAHAKAHLSHRDPLDTTSQFLCLPSQSHG